MDRFRPKATKIGYAPEFTLLWMLQALAACMAGYFAFGTIRIDLTIAVLAGIFCLAMFEHELHVLLGASTSRKPDEFPISLKKLAIAYLIGVILAGSYIVYYRPFALIGILAGIAIAVGYASKKIHLEEFWAVGWAIAMPIACYVASGYLTIQIAVILIAIALISGPVLHCYRALTGDYDNVPRTPILKRVIALYHIAFAVLILGFSIA